MNTNSYKRSKSMTNVSLFDYNNQQIDRHNI